MFHKINKKGFTLIEIIVVVAILAVLMSVAVPSVLKYIDSADDARYIANAKSVAEAYQIELVKKAGVNGGKITRKDAVDVEFDVSDEFRKDSLKLNNTFLYGVRGSTEANATSFDDHVWVSRNDNDNDHIFDINDIKSYLVAYQFSDKKEDNNYNSKYISYHVVVTPNKEVKIYKNKR